MTMQIRMHDWLLLDIRFKWEDSYVTILLRHNVTEYEQLTIGGVSNLHVPKLNEWGPSESINEVRGPVLVRDGIQRLDIEMQSGDVIEIEATSFNFPPRSIFHAIAEQ
jgi:hypothetical protein